MQRTTWIAVIVVVSLLTACSGDRIVGRFDDGQCNAGGATQKCSADQFIPAVVASVSSSTPDQTPGGPACGALSDHAAAECVKALASNTKSAAEFLKALATSLGDRDDDINLTRFKRNLALTIAKQSFNPTDRLDMIDVTIVPTEGEFATWNVAKSAYRTIDLGKIHIQEKRSTDLSLQAQAPPTLMLPFTASAKTSQENQRSEDFTATNRIEDLTVNLVDYIDPTTKKTTRSLRIFQQGAQGNDLAGTVLVNATILTTGASSTTRALKISRYRDKDGNNIKPSEVEVRPYNIVAKAFDGKDLRAKVKMTYTIRHVASGDQTIEERDDKAVYYTKTADDSPEFVLVPASQLTKPVYSIKGRTAANSDVIYPLKINLAANSPPSIVCFASVDEASALIRYLHDISPAAPSRIGPYTIGLLGGVPSITPLERRHVDLLFIDGGC